MTLAMGHLISPPLDRLLPPRPVSSSIESVPTRGRAGNLFLEWSYSEKNKVSLSVSVVITLSPSSFTQYELHKEIERIAALLPGRTAQIVTEAKLLLQHFYDTVHFPSFGEASIRFLTFIKIGVEKLRKLYGSDRKPPDYRTPYASGIRATRIVQALHDVRAIYRN